jgi:two-component system, cell cycle response regulator
LADEEVTRITALPLKELLAEEKVQRAYLIVLTGTNVGEMYKVDGEMYIGRSREAQIQLLDDGISRKHCRLIRIPSGAIVIEDLDSTNGTFANGVRITRQQLADGDKIQVGSTTILKFTYHDDLEENFQRQMYDSALRDGLTKAFNKRYFTDRLQSEFAYANRHETPLALCMMDLDFFKRVNDTHGHLAGDYVLATLAQQVARSVRTEDVFSRYGGEEFAVISRGIPVPNALVMAERIRTAVERHVFAWDGKRLPITVSLGVAGLPNPAIHTPAELVAATDRALYAAKHAGRNRVQVYDPHLDDFNAPTR